MFATGGSAFFDSFRFLDANSSTNLISSVNYRSGTAVMLTFLTIIGRSMRIAGVLLAADVLLSYCLTFLSYRFIETIGDSMLIEVALLFLLAGLLDFYSSVGAVQFRKVILRF